MKIPIPDDWAGDEWQCVQVLIPKSLLWEAVFRGAMSQLFYGRIWDERTGNVKSVQEIARTIYESVDPFVFCGDDCEQCDDCDCSARNACGGILVLESDDMGQVVTDVTLENGVLYKWFGPCCKIEVGDINAVIDEHVDGDLWGDGATFYACGKAQAILGVIWDIADAAWNVTRTNPLSWVGEVRAAAPGYSLSSTTIAELCILGGVVDGTYGESEVFDTYIWDTIVCQVSAQLNDDTAEMTSDEWSMIQNTIMTNFVAAGRLQAGTYFVLAASTLGEDNAKDAAVLGSTDSTAVCDCPDEPLNLFPGFDAGEDWVYVFDFREALPADAVLTGNDPQWTLGEGVWAYPGATDDQTDFTVTIPITNNTGTAAITKVAMCWTTRGDENWNDGVSSGVGTENDQVIAHADVIGVCGENPSQAGTWQLSKVCNLAISGGEPDQFKAVINCYHPPDTNPPDVITNSAVLVAIAFAGSGDDPRA